MKIRTCFALLFALALNVQAQNIQITMAPDDLLIENFEGKTWGKWTQEGNAFGEAPVAMERLQSWGDNRFEGSQMATSYVNGDGGMGTLKSPAFTIARNYINFLIGGGSDYQKEYVALWVDGKEVKRTTAYSRRIMENESWDVTQYKGKSAQIILVDNSTEGWGFINADCFFQSDKKLEKEFITKQMQVTHRYLNIPIRTGSVVEQVDMWIGGEMVRNMEIELDGINPSCWVTLDANEWIGKELKIETGKALVAEKALDSSFFSDTPKESDLLYKESLRPKAHFTSQRGWLNDPNGLVWYKGEWHLFYQHNPYGCGWGNMTWGHAVSSDLVHWKELGDVLHPDSLGPIFSGSVVVDKDNTLGVSQRTEETLVAIYTSAGGVGYHTRDIQHSQSIAFSKDGGRSWTKYSGNPVLPTLVRYNRDPKVSWYAPTKKWIMVLYLDKQEYAIFSSSDLNDWTEIDRFKLDGADECPDFFEMTVVNEPSVRKWVFTGANSTYLVGSFDGQRFVPESKPLKMDSGNNYYAVQTYSNAPDGRRVQIAWMNGSNFPNMPFNQQMSFPRELTLHHVGGEYILKSMPVKELALLYGQKHALSKQTIDKQKKTIPLNSTAFYLQTTFTVADNKGEILGFDVNGLDIIYNFDKQLLSVQKASGEILKQILLKPIEGKVELDILSDMGSVEFFANQGEVSAAFYHLSEKQEPTLSVLNKGKKVKLEQLVVHELNSMHSQQ